MNQETILREAEEKKAAEDLVRRAKEELAPVRAWAEEQKRLFLAGHARLRRRIDDAQRTINRLARLLGGMAPSELRTLWGDLQGVVVGIPGAYDRIVRDIDELTPWYASQHNYMVPLRDKPKYPPGSIATLEEVLGKLERSLAEHIEALQRMQPATPTTAGGGSGS